MSVADIWDRFFWSAMIVIFVGLVWLKFVDPVLSCVGPGLVVAVIAGGVYFYTGWHRARRETQESRGADEGTEEDLL